MFLYQALKLVSRIIVQHPLAATVLPVVIVLATINSSLPGTSTVGVDSTGSSSFKASKKKADPLVYLQKCETDLFTQESTGTWYLVAHYNTVY